MDTVYLREYIEFGGHLISPRLRPLSSFLHRRCAPISMG